jgi:hypothetical protein
MKVFETKKKETFLSKMTLIISSKFSLNGCYQNDPIGERFWPRGWFDAVWLSIIVSWLKRSKDKAVGVKLKVFLL